MQGEQARVLRQDMPVAVQTCGGSGHAGTGALLCPDVATLALHIHPGRVGVCGMAERHGLRDLHRQRGVGMLIYPYHGKHPRCTK